VVADRSRQREEARELMTALKTGSADRVRGLVREALRQSDSVVYTVSQFVDTARQEFEDMWYRGDLSVVDEDRMLHELEQIVHDLIRDRSPRRPAERRCLLSATDDVKGAINQKLLEEDGWSIHVSPPASLVADAQVASRVDRRVVVLTGDSGVAAPGMKSTIAALQALGSRVLVVAPGHWAHAGQWHQLGADACAADARTMLLLAGKLHSADRTFSIGEVAASLRVTPHAIRAWERRYKLPRPARDHSGQRTYTAEDVELLLRINHAVTVHGHSLKLAALEAQGLLIEELQDASALPSAAAGEAPAPNGQPWRRVADAIPELLMLVDSEGTIVDCNIATARLRDTVRENLRGARLTDLVIDYDRAKAARLYRPSPRYRDAWELRLRSRTGQQTVVAFDSRPVAAGGSRLLGLIGRTVSQAQDAQGRQAQL
jgi:DNA-binding transcriptional MerR regulator